MHEDTTETRDIANSDHSLAQVPTIKYDDVPAFVRSAPICVLYVGSSAPRNCLALRLFANHPRATAAYVRPSTSTFPSIPAGYHLFANGVARAYDPGVPDDSDVFMFAFGNSLGLVGRATKRFDLARFGEWIAEFEATARVVSSFIEALPDDEVALFASTSMCVERLDVARAFVRLGLPTSASRHEVEQRHRELIAANTPDVAARRVAVPDGWQGFADSVATVYAERRRELDDAQTLIRTRRGWR
jgi:hypothetical protein